MKYRKFSKFEKKENKQLKVKNALSGKGLFIYKNKSKHATLTLPRPTESGLRVVEADKEFQGDDYYLQMVRSGDLILVKVIDDGNKKPEPVQEFTPEPCRTTVCEVKREVLTEAVAQPKTQKKPKTLKESAMSEQKLLLDQPERVTTKGKTEHVVDKTTSKVKLNETDNQPQEPVLLNESPSDDGFLVLK
jgi:hypothetical protein